MFSQMSDCLLGNRLDERSSHIISRTILGSNFRFRAQTLRVQNSPSLVVLGKNDPISKTLVLLGQNFVLCMTTEEGKKLKQQTKCLFFVKGQPLYLKPSSPFEDDRMM